VELTVATTRRLMSCFSHLFSLKRALQSTFCTQKQKSAQNQQLSTLGKVPSHFLNYFFIFLFFQMMWKKYKVKLIGKFVKKIIYSNANRVLKIFQ
jgi:hypothetical protein